MTHLYLAQSREISSKYENDEDQRFSNFHNYNSD